VAISATFEVHLAPVPNVRYVPEAEVNPGNLNDRYGESCRSDFITQGRQSAQSRQVVILPSQD